MNEARHFTTPLYQEDSKGKPRVWSVATEGAKVIVSYGLFGGKIATKTTVSKGKNIGKANETSAEQQALLDAQSKWNHQVDREDYHWDISQAGKQLRPMLARDYTKVGHQVDWRGARWAVQPKLDGLRLTYGWRLESEGDPELLTRKGEVYKVPHIEVVSDRLIEIIRSITDKPLRGLDGELYLHGMPLNEINKRAKKYREGETERLEYHLFDLVMDAPFHERYNTLRHALGLYHEQYGNKTLCLVQAHMCSDEEQMKVFHKQFASEGYEGVMIRDTTDTYHMSQRPACLYKYKEFMDKEFKIVAMWEDKNGCAMFTCVTEGGKEFNCTPKRPHDERREMLKEPDQYVGKWLKVKFQAWTEYGVPEFPVGLDVRECDEYGNPVE